MKKILRLCYQPYKYFICIPVIALSTLVFGSLAVLLCMILDSKFVSLICGKTWAKLNGWITPVFVNINGKENIDENQSYVIAANHQSLYDIFLLYGWLGIDFKWIMKKELRKIPVLGISCEKLGHIFINRSDRNSALASINAAKKKIANGTSVIFFPEGTRSRSGKMGKFKKGAFKMALDLDLPILPITIMGTRAVLPPDTINIFPGKTEMIIHKPVSINGYNNKNINELVEKVRNIIKAPIEN